MNRSKIEWCDFTWNPVTGCLNNCSYCYARKIAKRFYGHFKPELHVDRLEQPCKVKKPSRIFVCSMGELFGEWVPREWIMAVIQTVYACPQHQFMFLSKNSLRYADFKVSPNALCGATVTNYVEAMNLCLNCVDYVSFEPLQEAVSYIPSSLRWIIVGAQTNPYRPPKAEWVEHIIQEARQKQIPVFLKDNLKWQEKIQEFPIWESILRQDGGGED